MVVKSEEELAYLVRSGEILRDLLKQLKKEARAGVTLRALDERAYQMIKDAGAQPTFLGYRPEGAVKAYPATICTSLNNVVVHGQPTNYVLQDGDVLKIDAGVTYQGLCTDAAITVAIGSVAPRVQRLIAVTERALYEGINASHIGNTIGDIGYAIQSVIEKAGFKVMEGLTGHGTGKKLHEAPTIYNKGRSGKGAALKEGMVLALEPMASLSTEHVKQIDDESYATIDGGISAHFEHTIIVTKNGPRILTQ